MIDTLLSLTFAQPWILAGLAALPALWVILRITPPPPRIIRLPSARFLKGLIPEKITAAHTPWWLLLLRLVIAALVIGALAMPIINPAQALKGSGAVRLVIDNGWSAAPNWEQQIKTALDITARAEREERSLHLLTTAVPTGANVPETHANISAAQARSIIKSLSVQPWEPDYDAVIGGLTQTNAQAGTTYWLSDGLRHSGYVRLKQTLAELSSAAPVIMAPDPENLPLILKLPQSYEADGLGVRIEAPAGYPSGQDISALVQSADGQVLDRQSVTLKDISAQTGGGQDVFFDLPEDSAAIPARIIIAGQSSAAATFLLDESYQKRRVGIAAPGQEEKSKPFIDAGFYLQRALKPYAEIENGDLSELLKSNPSVLILPDITAMAAATLNDLEDWVKKGGVLLRFAGPNMTRNLGSQSLLPVAIRSGGRSMQGALSWEEPQKLKGFPEGSPLAGIPLRDDLTIARQVLAEPEEGLDEKTWAELEDGTPLITAKSLERGLVILVHTSASSDWSDLPLSGTYVDILRRIVALSSLSSKASLQISGALNAQSILDGFGHLHPPPDTLKPLALEDTGSFMPSHEHPPGLYTSGAYSKALNLGPSIERFYALPDDINTAPYSGQRETPLMPHLLSAAALLFLLDGIIMLFMLRSGRNLFSKRFKISMLAISFFAALSLLPAPASAQQEEQAQSKAIHYTQNLMLAYVQTGNANIDSATHRGLEVLAETLTRRTSAEPQGIAALYPAHDTLEFFPLIYWAVTPDQEPLSDQALINVQHYLDYGGTIIFDMLRPDDPAQNQALRRIMAGLNVPPLVPVNEEHVLHKTFYLLDEFTGLHAHAPVWVERESRAPQASDNEGGGRDGVSSVIIGAHNWAGAWAVSDPSPTGQYTQPREREYALRTGVNLVMYALTGNYKADQVHVKELLQRMGR